MKILLLSVGKKHDPALADAIGDFTARIGRYAPVEWKFISPVESGVGSVDAESKSILAALSDSGRDHVVLLDEKGKAMTSPGLAQFLEKRLNEGTHRLVFIIGGAFGVNESVRGRADIVLKISDLVFPHQLVRLILAEQLYRAFTITRGEKYHHE